MGDRNIFQPSAAATLLTSLEDVQVSALMMASRQNEVLQTILEIEKSLPELCERKEMKKSLAALFAQQNQLVDLTNSMSEQLCSLQTSRPETTEIPNSTRCFLANCGVIFSEESDVIFFNSDHLYIL